MSARTGIVERLAARFDDPILLKELRAAFRKRRFLALQTGLLVVLALVIVGYMWYLSSEYPKDPSEIGRKTFLAFARLELALILILFPAFSCTSVTDERAGRTIDLLLTTKLSPLAIVRGKILAAFAYGLLFIVATLPIVALTFLYGGVTPGQIALTYGVMIVLAGIVTVFGVALSTVGGSTFQAVLRAYTGNLILVIPLVSPLLTTEPFASVTPAAEPKKAQFLSGVLAIQVFGPLSKDAALTELRDGMRTWGAAGSFLYWAAHVAFYASLASFFLVFARNRLAPVSENRARPMRLWFLGTVGTGLAIALASFFQLGLDTESDLEGAFVTTETLLFLFFVFGSMAFGGEDPVLPRKLRAKAGSLSGWRKAWLLLEPGAPNGRRFVFYTAVLAQAALVACFLSLAVKATGLETPGVDKVFSLIWWGGAWSLAFVFFLAELATLLAWSLRHTAASALSILCLAIVLMLYPSLWFAFDDRTAPASIYKGYAVSPVAVLRSLEDPPSDLNRSLVMFGPSGADLQAARQAFQNALGEFMLEAHDEKKALEKADPVLERARLDAASAETVRRHVRAAMERLRADPRWQDWSRPGIFFQVTSLTPAQEASFKEWTRARDDAAAALVHELAQTGVPVHVVSTFVFVAAGLVLLIVNRRGLAQLALQVARAEGEPRPPSNL